MQLKKWILTPVINFFTLKDKKFPTLFGSILFLILSSILAIIFSGIFVAIFFRKETITNKIATELVFTVFNFVFSVLIIKSYYKKAFKSLFNFKLNYWIIFPMFLVILGSFIISSSMDILFNFKDRGILDFLKMGFGSDLNLILIIAMVSFSAPFFEEIIFRGFILRGFIGNYSPFVSVFISAIMFSLIHFNPAQSVNAFILGFTFGIVFIKLKSIIPAMIMHFINNGIGTGILLMVIFSGEKLEIDNSEQPESKWFALIGLLGLFFIYLGLKYIFKLSKLKNQSILPNKEETEEFKALLFDDNIIIRKKKEPKEKTTEVQNVTDDSNLPIKRVIAFHKEDYVKSLIMKGYSNEEIMMKISQVTRDRIEELRDELFNNSDEAEEDNFEESQEKDNQKE